MILVGDLINGQTELAEHTDNQLTPINRH